VLVPVGLFAGLVKSRLILDPSCARIAARIEARGSGRCIGGFLSVQSWLLVGAMAVGGRLLRSVPEVRPVVAVVYVAVGVGLVVSSRGLWRAWRAAPRSASSTAGSSPGSGAAV
jgi:hypothetical protein